MGGVGIAARVDIVSAVCCAVDPGEVLLATLDPFEVTVSWEQLDEWL